MRRFALGLLLLGCAPNRVIPPPTRITDLRAEVTCESIRLTWRVAGDAGAPFRVDRRDGGDWFPVGETALTEFTDREFPDLEVVEYRVSSAVAGAETLRVGGVPVFQLRVIAAMENGAAFAIEKIDPDHGRVSIARSHRPGDRIGWWVEREGQKPTCLHTIAVERRSVKIDWNTGCVLQSCGKVRVAVKRGRCRPIYDDHGETVGCERVEEEWLRAVLEVVWSDRRGETTRLLMPDPSEERDSPCPHVALNARKRVDALERRARELLAEADALWETDSEKAIGLYKKLLDDYGDTPVVKGARTKIQKRAEQ